MGITNLLFLDPGITCYIIYLDYASSKVVSLLRAF